MPASLAAAIDLRGVTMRFAALGRDATPVVHALGDVAFDVPVWTMVGQETRAAELAGAVADVFAGVSVERLAVVVHPPDVPTWSAAVGPDGAAQLTREATVLLGSDPDFAAARIAAASLGTDANGQRWVQVIALTDAQEAGLARVAAALGLRGADLRVGPHAAARLVPRTVTPAMLLIGLHRDPGGPAVAEFALVDGQGLRFVGSVSTADPVEIAFAAIRLTATAGVREGVGGLMLYGSGAHASDTVQVIESVIGVRASLVDPFAVVAPLPGGSALREMAPLLAPVVGAALAGLDA